MPANGHDIYNYVARFGSANFQIQAVLKLNGRLDSRILKKAVRLSADAEPVFGCRFVEHQPPYWRRLEDIDNIRFCMVIKTENPDKAVQRFLESPMDMDRDPMVRLKLIKAKRNDILCIKLNHACCDGTGTKEYLQLLADIYTCLDSNDIFIPIPRNRSRIDQDRLFRALAISNPDSAWDPKLEYPKNMWTFPWKQGKKDNIRYTVCQLSKGGISRLHRYGRLKGVTVNDLILTALYRAMFAMAKPDYRVPMDISLTIDLRRYLPNQKTEAIRCFSGSIDTRLARIPNESFEETLSRTVAMMNRIKSGHPGLQSAVGLERVEKAEFKETLAYYQEAEKNARYTNKCTPTLSNLGFISKSVLKFGKTAVNDAFIVPTILSAPSFLICTGTYNDILTISASYYEKQIYDGYIKELLYRVRNELVNGCKL